MEKPNKCGPYQSCYGPFSYCSSASNSGEPCLEETILNNRANLKKFCEDLVQEKNVSMQIRDQLCKLKEDCFSEFGFQESNGQDNKNELQTLYIVISVAVAVILVAILIYCGHKNKFKRTKETVVNEDVIERASGEGVCPMSIETERKFQANKVIFVSQSMQSTRSGDLRTDDQTVTEPLLGQTSSISIRDVASLSSPGSSTSTDSTSDISIASNAGGESREESQGSTSAISAESRSSVHPAVVENSRLRGVHMPSAEPHDENKTMLVTSGSKYNHAGRK